MVSNRWGVSAHHHGVTDQQDGVYLPVLAWALSFLSQPFDVPAIGADHVDLISAVVADHGRTVQAHPPGNRPDLRLKGRLIILPPYPEDAR
jgi:hypothetical protein